MERDHEAEAEGAVGMKAVLGVQRMPTRSGRGTEMGTKAKDCWKAVETWMHAYGLRFSKGETWGGIRLQPRTRKVVFSRVWGS